MNKQIFRGEIKKVTFGYGGHKDCFIGIKFYLGGEGWAAFSDKVAWDLNLIPPEENRTWNEKERDNHYAKIVRYISNLLFTAKVNCIDELTGKPVEAVFIDDRMESWRIL